MNHTWLLWVCLCACPCLLPSRAAEDAGKTGKEASVFQPCPLPHGKWEPLPAFTDEFDGTELDATKWFPYNPTWKGREPAFFNPANVTLKDGMLHLAAKAEDLPNLPKGYHTFTTAFVKSKALARYGYFEIKSRAMNSKASSAYWFYAQTPEIWSEIDIFEIGAGKYPHRYFMNVHLFHTLVETIHWDHSITWEAPYKLAEEFHVYGLEWDSKEVKYYVDGKVVRTRENTHWHQPLNLCFDSETFADWFGLPDKETLPAVFSLEYVRAWRRLDGPPDDKVMACEFRFPGRKETGNKLVVYKLKTDDAGSLLVKATGGGERPTLLVLEYDNPEFYAAQTEAKIQKKVTIKDESGKELAFVISYAKRKDEKAHSGYRPCGVDVLPAAKKDRGATEEYAFKAEDGTAVQVAIRY